MGIYTQPKWQSQNKASEKSKQQQQQNQYNVRLHLIMTNVSQIMASHDEKNLVARGKGREEAKWKEE